jgi:hypothetical protein
MLYFAHRCMPELWGRRQADLARSSGEQSALLNSPHDIIDRRHQEGESDTLLRR